MKIKNSFVRCLVVGVVLGLGVLGGGCGSIKDSGVQDTTLPIAEFFPSSQLGSLKVVFDASESYDSESNIINYSWDFDGDGIEDSKEKITEFSYSTTGRQRPKLTVVNGSGLSSKKEYEIEVLTQDYSLYDLRVEFNGESNENVTANTYIILTKQNSTGEENTNFSNYFSSDLKDIAQETTKIRDVTYRLRSIRNDAHLSIFYTQEISNQEKIDSLNRVYIKLLRKWYTKKVSCYFAVSTIF